MSVTKSCIAERTYVTVGFKGLSPFMFEVEGALLQPRVELNLHQDVPENRLSAGLTDAKLGLRLRYDIRRQVASYVCVSYVAQTRRTADIARV